MAHSSLLQSSSSLRSLGQCIPEPSCTLSTYQQAHHKHGLGESAAQPAQGLLGSHACGALTFWRRVLRPPGPHETEHEVHSAQSSLTLQSWAASGDRVHFASPFRARKRSGVRHTCVLQLRHSSVGWRSQASMPTPRVVRTLQRQVYTKIERMSGVIESTDRKVSPPSQL